MAVEQIGEYLYHIAPGPIDVHAHPRAFDAITQDPFVEMNGGTEGKAGLAAYTEVALKSGIVAMIMMPNEQLRQYDIESPELTRLVPYPLSSLAHVLATESLITQQAVEPVAIHFGVDPAELFYDEGRTILNHEILHERFRNVGDEVTSLKLYGGETTGGYNVHPQFLPSIIRIWNEYYPDKPAVLHLEDEHVAQVLNAVQQLPNGKEIPLHIAHVSSREELEAVIEAKRAGMNVTCEVTVHHLFLDGGVREEIGGYGCVKPSLKTPADIDFLRAHLDDIDIIASDCAPHRRSDKEAASPAYGLATHTVMLPLLFGLVEDGALTHEELYQKLCITPRRRFNLPVDDGSFIEYHTAIPDELSAPSRALLEARYGHNPFVKTARQFRMVGAVVNAHAGVSDLRSLQTSYRHVIRPSNIATEAA